MKWWANWIFTGQPVRLAYQRWWTCRRGGHDVFYDGLFCLRCGTPWRVSFFKEG